MGGRPCIDILQVRMGAVQEGEQALRVCGKSRVLVLWSSNKNDTLKGLLRIVGS